MVFKKNKKGIEAVGFSIIIGIIISLLAGGVIIAVVKESASKADEKLQVELCRVSNEIRYFYKQKTSDVADALTPDPPRICSTIDKTTKKSQVPTDSYPQNEAGASMEIRDMIKNCWYMWLEGSENNMFNKMPFGRGCFLCYVFEVKKGIGEGDVKVDFDRIQKSMNDPFFASDKSDKCAPTGGFILSSCRDNSYCPEELKPDLTECAEGWSRVPSIKAAAQDSLCCVKKGGLLNECENKGGICYVEGEDDEENIADRNPFDVWSCQRGRCYVKNEDHYTYTKYITQSPRGGDVYFIPPGNEEIHSTDYAKSYGVSKKFAISFISPARQFCAVDGADKKCIAGMVGFAVAGTAAVLLVPAVAPVALGAAGTAAGAAGTVVSTVGATNTVVATAAIGTAAYGAKEAGIFGKLIRGIANKVLQPITKEAPSLMIVSSIRHANSMGCLANN